MNVYKILLVEDDDVDIMNIQRAFSKTNLINPMVVAKNGLEALDILRGVNGGEPLRWPYVVLLDLNMPKMNGLEFLDAVRKDAKLRNIPIVILTSSSREEDICESYKNQVAGYITKPVEMTHFIEKVAIFGKYWALCEM